MTTAYDRVAYPSVVHEAVHPERLEVLARLAGLDPVPVQRARVLDIGGGSCFSLTAFAAQYPGADAHGFDLAERAIAHGKELAGPECPNVHLVVEDITKAKARYAARSFDYVIAHGVYAWVPDMVREALLEFVGHVLSERGVAFISFNAMPGCHVRLLLREMLLYEIQGIDDPETRIERAYAFLHDFADAGPEDEALTDPFMAGVRSHAASMAKRSPSVVFHDELGEWFSPQSLSQVVRDAAPHGLRWLTDAGRNRHFDGFLAIGQDPGDDVDETVLRSAQSRDYLKMAFFRAPLFVRKEAPVDRHLDIGRIKDLWVSSDSGRTEGGDFRKDDDVFSIADQGMAERLEALNLIWPDRRPVTEIAQSEDQLRALMKMYEEWYVALHTGPAPFAAEPGDRPKLGAWIGGMLARGELNIVTLASQTLRIDQAELRNLLMLADGTRTIEELVAAGHGMAPDQVPGAIAAAARRGFFVA